MYGAQTVTSHTINKPLHTNTVTSHVTALKQLKLLQTITVTSHVTALKQLKLLHTITVTSHATALVLFFKTILLYK
jgi:hypothetical protein